MTNAASFLSASLGLALLLPACSIDTPPPEMVPKGPTVARIEDLGGNYCYYGPAYNVRTFRRALGYLPFFDFESLAGPTLLTVRAEKSRIVFTYPGRTGGTVVVHVFDVESAGGQWQGTSLVLPPRISPGLDVRMKGEEGTTFSRGGTTSRLFKLSDGRLVLTTSFIEKGLQIEPGSDEHSSKPSWNEKEDSVVVILEPAAGACDATPTARPLQPLFEPGLDIRVPACVAVLEEQVASILAEKGESPETAEAAARDTAQGFSSPADASRFTVQTRSEGVTRSYFFHVSESSEACTLKLHGRAKRTKRSGSSWSSFASRKLPGCACVD